VLPKGEDLAVIEACGFQLSRIGGPHHLYTPPDESELINLHNIDGKAKPYQIKQSLDIVERYNLPLNDL
jgi:hypothetical protein